MTIVLKENVVLLMARYIECINALSWLSTQPEVKRREYFDMEIKSQLESAAPDMRSAIERAYTFEAQDARLKWSARYKRHLHDARLMFALPDACEQWWELNQTYYGQMYVDKTSENSQPALVIPEDFPPTLLFMEHSISADTTLMAAYAIQDGHVLVLHVDDKGIALTHLETDHWLNRDIYAVGLALRGRIERQSIGTNDRRALAKAKLQPRRDFYFAGAYKYVAQPRSEPLGGTHASPVAHERNAHMVCRTKLDVQPEQVQDLLQRGYVVVDGSDVPEDVRLRMRRFNKTPEAGKLAAYLWVPRSGSKVNPDGPQARKVQLVAKQ